MSTTNRLGIAGISLAVAATVWAVNTKVEAIASEKKAAILKATAESQLQILKDQEEADLRLGQYTINMMYRSGAGTKISDGRKQVLARAIIRVSNEILETLEQRHAWIGAIAIESAFQKFAQSPTGPKGLGQMARASFHEGIAKCGINKVDDEDVFETDLNLYASACYFRAMLERSDNDPIASMVSYNQGPNSEDAKNYLKNGNINGQEALKYIAKATFLKRNVTDKKIPGVPSMEELGKNIKSK